MSLYDPNGGMSFPAAVLCVHQPPEGALERYLGDSKGLGFWVVGEVIPRPAKYPNKRPAAQIMDTEADGSGLEFRAYSGGTGGLIPPHSLKPVFVRAMSLYARYPPLRRGQGASRLFIHGVLGPKYH